MTTGGPEICIHVYVNGPELSGSYEPLPSSCIGAVAAYLGKPASAMGAWFISASCPLELTVMASIKITQIIWFCRILFIFFSPYNLATAPTSTCNIVPYSKTSILGSYGKV
jgi:hypothetical protein